MHGRHHDADRDRRAPRLRRRVRGATIATGPYQVQRLSLARIDWPGRVPSGAASLHSRRRPRVTAIAIRHLFIAAWLALALTQGGPHATAQARSGPMTVTPPWQRFTYGGAFANGGAGRPATLIHGYTLAYPSRWMARLWPDTRAGYGQIDLHTPWGSAIDLMVIPLRPHGPSLSDLIAHDASLLVRPQRDRVALPLGMAIRLSNGSSALSVGRALQFLYVQRGPVVYRLFISHAPGILEGRSLMQVAATIRVRTGMPVATVPPPLYRGPTTVACCRCPAWGPGWGAILTRIDGVAVYSNAGDVYNGCVGTYGLSYQCVELVQRYFAVRWGYPPMWWGVGAAADMPVNHPRGVVFIPNGGFPGPREGDALVFYGGAFGHVALVQRVDRQTGLIDVVEENWSSAGEVSLPIYPDDTVAVRNSVYGTYTVAGWLHSTLNTSQDGAR